MNSIDAADMQPQPAIEPASMPLHSGLLKATTIRAYEKAMAHFRNVFNGRIPCDRAMLDGYIASMRKNAPSTVYLRVQALRHEHVRQGLPSPTEAPEVRALLRQLQRGIVPAKVDRTGRVRAPAKRKEPRQARPLTRALIAKMFDAMGTDSLDRRDRCLILLGFSAGLSGPALVGLNVADVQLTNDAILVSIAEATSGASQEVDSRRVIAVPRTGHELCAARATAEWIAHAQLDEHGGPLIRRFDRAGDPTRLRLEAAYVGSVIKRRLRAVGIDPAPFSSLSLKRGKRAELAKGLL